MRILKYLLLAYVILVVGIFSAIYIFITHRTEGKYFNSNGVRIHYTDEGSGEPVILLHGFAVNSDLNFRRPGIIRLLKKEFRVIAMDLRGHGLSDKPHDSSKYGMEMVNDVIRLMDYLHIKKAHLAGYSMGGAITLKLAVTHPERFITASPLGMGWELTRHSRLLKALPELAEKLRSKKGIDPLAGKLGTNRRRPGAVHTFWVRVMTKFFNDREALAAMIRGISAFEVTEKELRNISIPVCSIVGSKDPLKKGVDAMVGKIKNHKVVIIEGADHITAPMNKKFRETLFEFLKTNSENMK